jgi:hypothetical protein
MLKNTRYVFLLSDILVLGTETRLQFAIPVSFGEGSECTFEGPTLSRPLCVIPLSFYRFQLIGVQNVTSTSTANAALEAARCAFRFSRDFLSHILVETLSLQSSFKSLKEDLHTSLEKA